MPKKPKPPKCGRVTHVSVSRLFNLGNYCNRKIEVSAEVSPGQSASQTLANLYWIVENLAPIKRPHCYENYLAAAKKPAESQEEYEKNHIDEWAEEIQKYEARKALRAQSLTLLDDLGGATQYTDHKNKWDFGDDIPF